MTKQIVGEDRVLDAVNANIRSKLFLRSSGHNWASYTLSNDTTGKIQ